MIDSFSSELRKSQERTLNAWHTASSYSCTDSSPPPAPFPQGRCYRAAPSLVRHYLPSCCHGKQPLCSVPAFSMWEAVLEEVLGVYNRSWEWGIVWKIWEMRAEEKQQQQKTHTAVRILWSEQFTEDKTKSVLLTLAGAAGPHLHLAS